MIDSLKDNLVVGIDDDKVWSVAQRTGYPVNVDGSRKTGYYGVPTVQTKFSASHGAILNTEIWRVKKDDSGSYMKDTDGDYQVEYSVKVTGEGTSGGDPSKTPTVDEQKWNGAYPFFAEKEEKYVVSYYWQLKDGRYVTDHKVVTVKPSTHTLTVLSKDGAGADNSTALYVDA